MYVPLTLHLTDHPRQEQIAGAKAARVGLFYTGRLNAAVGHASKAHLFDPST